MLPVKTTVLFGLVLIGVLALMVACDADAPREPVKADAPTGGDQGRPDGPGSTNGPGGPAPTPSGTPDPQKPGAEPSGPAPSNGPGPKPADAGAPNPTPNPASGPDVGGPAPSELRLPPPGAGFDYQLGGAYAPPAAVTVVTRDRLASPAAGLYNICYVNGFQAQPDETDDWEADLLLRDAGGQVVIDPDWNEALLDITSDDKRTRIAAVVTGFMQRCKSAGFDAIEIDNLDTYSRSGGRITMDDAVRFMRLLSDAAHGLGLPIAQKNAAELLDQRSAMGTDFAVSEECATWRECGDYVQAYGDHVLMIEYVRKDFDRSCMTYAKSHSLVLRDVDLVEKGQGGYVFALCE